MKALTLKQPWAGFVASGIKTVENRGRPIAPRDLFGQRFALHAGLATDELGHYNLEKSEPRPWPELCSATGCIIATATLADALYVGGCSREHIATLLEKRGLGDQARFAFGPTIYLLTDIVALPKVLPCRGWQGFWTVPRDVEAHIAAQQAKAA